MRSLMLATIALLGLTAMPALAQTSSLDPATGARPGHEPGIGTSLPLSNNASNIETSDTRSLIAPTLPASQAGTNATVTEYLTAARASQTNDGGQQRKVRNSTREYTKIYEKKKN
jgi:hypothetical protein